MLISILTPSFGYGRFIGDTVASVLSQADPNVEQIVMDGASRDETVDVLKSFASDGRLVWRSNPDQGQSDALNHALTLASGEWVGWLNADEFYLADALSRVRATIDRFPDADVIYADFAEVDADGCLERVVAQHRFSMASLRRTCYIPSCTTFIRRAVLTDRPWDVACRQNMDWDLFLDLANRDLNFRHIREPLAAFRVHPEQVTKDVSFDRTEELASVRSRHRIPLGGRGLRQVELLGRGVHVTRKLLEGGYARERSARAKVGQDLRWFANAPERPRQARSGP